jgi:hypothetical protein
VHCQEAKTCFQRQFSLAYHAVHLYPRVTVDTKAHLTTQPTLKALLNSYVAGFKCRSSGGQPILGCHGLCHKCEDAKVSQNCLESDIHGSICTPVKL